MARILMVKTASLSENTITAAASPPLGLMTLAAYLRSKGLPHVFKLVDERLSRWGEKEWGDCLDDFRPRYISISSLTLEADHLYSLVDFFKKKAPDTPVILGGPHATAYGTAVLAKSKIDFVVGGEGEVPFLQLIEALEQGERQPNGEISGLSYRRSDGSLYSVPINQDVLAPEELPLAAWDLADLDAYSATNRMTPLGFVRYAPLFTSRGCPFHCTYCHSIFKKGFRAMSAARVVDEIEFLIREYDVHHFEIFDDIFNLDYDRTLEFCAEIKRRGLETHFSFPNGVRGDLLDRKILEELRSVGTYHMAFAVESASPRIQKLIRKNNNLDLLRENIAIAAELGIFTWGFFMMGFPTETRREILQTVKYAADSRLHGAFFFVVVPFGGTEMAGQCKRPGDISFESADYHYTHNSLSEVSSAELNLWQIYSFVNFFYKPDRLWRILRTFPFPFSMLAKHWGRFTKYLVYYRPVSMSKYMFNKALAAAEEGLGRPARSSRTTSNHSVRR